MFGCPVCHGAQCIWLSCVLTHGDACVSQSQTCLAVLCHRAKHVWLSCVSQSPTWLAVLCVTEPNMAVLCHGAQCVWLCCVSWSATCLTVLCVTEPNMSGCPVCYSMVMPVCHRAKHVTTHVCQCYMMLICVFAATSSVLTGVMGYRFLCSGKIMPAGVVALLRLVLTAVHTLIVQTPLPVFVQRCVCIL